MSIIVFAIIVVLILALLIWAISVIDVIPNPPKQILMALVIVLGAVLIAQRAGVF